MTRREQAIKLDEELRQVRQRERELLEERRILRGTPTREILTHAWTDPIYKIIKANPDISRQEIFLKFNNPYLLFGDLTDILTTLRRRGLIKKRRGDQHWYVTENPGK